MLEYIERYRTETKESDDIRDAGLTTPDDIERVDNIQYGVDPHWNLLDVYRLRSAAGHKLPVIINVHGGGWIYGDKERYQYYSMQLAQRGFSVVNFTYRLAPEYLFPAPLEDLNLIAEWVLQNAEKYSMNSDKLFAVGDSAGAQILGTYAAIVSDPGFAENFSFKIPEGFRLSAIGLNCGAYKIDMSKKDELITQHMQAYLPDKGSEKEQWMMCVLNHITPVFPPAFITTALGDFLRNDAPLLSAKLDECNVPHVYRLYGTTENPLGHVFHCDVRLKEGWLCNDEECSFFKSFL